MNLKVRVIVICWGIITVFFALCHNSVLVAQSKLEITRDKDKTIYSIESSKQSNQEEKDDKDKTWEMLKNSGVIINKRKSSSTQNGITPPNGPK
jgi:hypothetical protein